MCLKGKSYLPVLAALVAGIGLIQCYFMAVMSGNIPALPLWPSVSDVGAESPERQFFTLVTNWTAILVVVVAYLYYRYVQQTGCESSINGLALCAAVVASIGMSIAGSFQNSHATSLPHDIASYVLFAFSSLYCFLILIINIVFLERTSKCVVLLRGVIFILQSISLIIYFVLSRMSEKGLLLEVVRTSSEWAVVYSYIFYVLIFTYEFSKFSGVEVFLVANNTSKDEEGFFLNREKFFKYESIKPRPKN